MINVLLVEDDLYARNWMALLIARDWRTSLAGEMDSPFRLSEQIQSLQTRIDLVLLDTGVIGGDTRNFQLEDPIASGIPLLLIGSQADPDVLDMALSIGAGYILKSEIDYSLAWAIDFCQAGFWPVTPGVRDLMDRSGYPYPANAYLLDGRHTPASYLSQHDLHVMRLAILFSLERRDMADELSISEDYSNGLVSEIYTKLGVKDLLENPDMADVYLGENEIVHQHLNEIINHLRKSKKAKDQEALAFHILTAPEITFLEGI